MSDSGSTLHTIHRVPGLWNDATANGACSFGSITVCTRLCEVLAGSSTFPEWVLPNGDEEEPVSRQCYIVHLVWLAAKPMVYSPLTQLPCPPAISRGKPCWPRSDFFIHASCVNLQLRIYHERIIEEIISYLFANVDLVCDTLYGAICGYDMVVALRIDNVQTRSLDAWHVSFDLLPFSQRAEDPGTTTRFLTHLTRLQPSASLVWRTLSIFAFLDRRRKGLTTFNALATSPSSTFPGSLCSLPPELLSLIIHYVHDEDLLSFALASRTTMFAVHATQRIRYPWIAGYRLVAPRTIHLALEVTPDGQVIPPTEDIHTPYAAFVTESDEILLIGLGFDNEALKSRFVRASASGTLLVQYSSHVASRIPFAVISKDVLENLERDATREGLLGRMMRRRERLITSWTEQYAEWVSMRYCSILVQSGPIMLYPGRYLLASTDDRASLHYSGCWENRVAVTGERGGQIGYCDGHVGSERGGRERDGVTPIEPRLIDGRLFFIPQSTTSPSMLASSSEVQYCTGQLNTCTVCGKTSDDAIDVSNE